MKALWFALSLASVLAAQAPRNAKPAAERSPAHTPDGQPDLQGYWTNATFTPLERPAQLAGKEFYTEAEAVAFQAERLRPAQVGNGFFNVAPVCILGKICAHNHLKA